MQDAINVSALSAAHKELFKKRIKEQNLPVFTLPIDKQPDGKLYPLSYGQERLWFVCQLEENASMYNLFSAIRIEDYVDLEVLGKSLDVLVKRHEALRTVFSINEEGQIAQRVEEYTWVPLVINDIRGFDNQEKEKQLQQLLIEKTNYCFSLVQLPLIKADIFLLDERSSVFLLNIHHIISDGWSIQLITRELLEIYEAISKETVPYLEALPVQYKDFACWQREWLNKDFLALDVSYWKDHLNGIPSYSTFPVDYQRPQKQTFKGKKHYFQIPTAQLEALKLFSKSQGVSLYITMLTAFKVLLYRYTGCGDVVLGTPVSGRNRSETEGIVGCFVNSLVLFSRLSAEKSFAESLQTVAGTYMEAHDHQNFPFEQLLEELNVERNLEYSPLFQLFFIFQNNRDRKNNGLDSLLKWEPVYFSNLTSKFDITVEVIETNHDMIVSFEYNTDLYKPETIRLLSQHYNNLLFTAINNETEAISSIDFLSENERKSLLYGFNNTQLDYPKDICVHELVDVQVEKTPEATAVECGQTSFTYNQLKEKSDNLCANLIKRGVAPGDKIGVYINSSPELIFSLLGILKAGCAYVPLDPSFPVKRLEYIVENAGIKVVLTKENNQPEFGTQTELIYVDGGKHIWQPQLTNFRHSPTSADLSYIMYTSGSTGNPKGVMIPHSCVVNFLYGMRRIFPLTDKDTLLSVTTYSFDISVLEFFLPLISGSKLILTEKEVQANGMLLKEKISTCRPTYMQATPATWSMLLSAGLEKIEDLNILCGGEELKKDVAGKLLEKGKSLWNLYGPTETTIWSLFHQVTTSDISIPIGKPIANTQVYVLDRNQKLVPKGAVGDLFIGGDGVAYGYYNNEKQTTERFIDNPFSGVGKLFNTGDRARIAASGVIEFLGRDDQQVKVRGFRIEVGEIELRLNSHKGIQQSVVVAKKDSSHQNILVAYLVPDREHHLLDLSLLRSFLKQELPPYMVPSLFIFLDKLPLTPNGKVDRKSLMEKVLDGVVVESSYIEPEGRTETELSKIWQEILNIKKTGAEDNFFSLGGHSILAVQLMAKTNKMFQANIPLIQLFFNPTIRAFAAIIDSKEFQTNGQTSYYNDLPVIEPNPAEIHKPFKLTDVQLAYWTGRNTSTALGGISTHIYQEIDVLDLDHERFINAFQYLIFRHPMLRATILEDGTQRILEETPVYEIEKFDLRFMQADEALGKLDEIKKYMAEEVLPAHKWPLFNIKLSLQHQNITRIHISFDLLIGDAWSFQIMLKEIAQLYQNGCNGLPVSNISFRDYVVAVEKLTFTTHYTNAKNYWQSRLAALPSAPQLPLQVSPESVQRPSFKRYKATLSADVWAGLCNQIKKHSVTKTSFLAACFSEVLSLWSRKPHFTLNLTLFNRLPLHKHVNHVVGDFTTINLLEVNTAGKKNFSEQIHKIQEQLWKDLDHRLYSGVRVTEDLIKQNLIHEPFPVVFTSMVDLEYEQNDYFAKTFDVVNEALTSENNISQTPQVWLDHQVMEKNGRLLFNWDVACELFAPGVVDEMFQNYHSLLENLAAHESLWNEASPFSSPRFVSPYYKHLQDIQKLHVTARPVPEGLITDGFLQQAKHQPEQLAVITKDRGITYLQLNNAANAVAAQLVDFQVKKNELVAIVMEKGWEQVVAAIGIIKAGAAYLPIDATYPKDRVLQLLEIGKVKSVVVQADQSSHLDLPLTYNTINVNATDIEYTGADILSDNKNSDLAYVIFTSGSTGIPKGVMIDHKGALNTIEDINQRFKISQNDVVFGISALNFDLSVYDIFGTLSAGGRLVLPDRELLRDPYHWATLVKTHKVTVWNSVPALVKMLVEVASNPGELESLRLVMMSGDWIPVDLPTQVRQLCKNINIVSLGGATEASVWSILYPVEEVKPEWKSIPYGISMANQQIYVLNERFDICPKGVKGELYIGGVGVALGYWNDEKRSGERFIQHPVTTERLFKTGDHGRYMANGVIEFLGREDLQVKVAGYRIELGEIEAVFKQHEKVKEAFVNVKGESDKMLEAFLLLKEDRKPEASDQNLPKNLILDPLKRMEFKLEDSAIRKDLHSTPIPLLSEESDDEYLKRRSYRKFSGGTIPFDRFGKFLSCLSRRRFDKLLFPKFLYGSAGGVYPVQVYLYIRTGAVEKLEGGFYYYDPSVNSLSLISENQHLDASAHVKENKEIFEKSAFSIFLISHLDSIVPLYGEENSKMYSFLEAGLMTQLLEMKAPLHNIGLCQIGMIHSDKFLPLLKLTSSHLYLHTIAGGPISNAQFTVNAMVDELEKNHQTKNTDQPDHILKEIKLFIQSRLPAYMVPNTINQLAELPITSNGKIDRKALKNKVMMKEINHIQSEIDINLSLIENDITDIWKNCLSLGKIEVTDNFFDLGGNSFKIIEVHKQLKSKFKFDIPIVDLFRFPTVKKLADHLRSTSHSEEATKDPSFEKASSRAELRLSRRRR